MSDLREHNRKTYENLLYDYIANMDNPFPKRSDYGKICGVAPSTIRMNFTAAELRKIEDEAISIRRRTCNKQRSNVLDALYKRAVGYDTPKAITIKPDGTIEQTIKHVPADKGSAAEFLDRTEGKVVDKKQFMGEDGKDIVPVINIEVTRT